MTATCSTCGKPVFPHPYRHPITIVGEAPAEPAPNVVREIEAVLADLLDTYAELRSRYIRGDANDYHSLKGLDVNLADECAGIRQAAYLIRNHRDGTSGMGLPVYLWDEWAERERAASERLDQPGSGNPAIPRCTETRSNPNTETT
ncbi:hypothetical protein [Nocardia sp. NPDC057455]|uniref:hypothetical protein n=1 Tax=Nocardia sp. NPDC057455 TaxID=3346138 RepID=UPI003671B4F6